MKGGFWRCRPGTRREAGVFLLFVLLGIVACFPLPLHFAGRTLIGRLDKYIFIWDLWWVREALFTPGQPLFHTQYLFYPHGTSLIYHTLFPLGGFLSIPLQAAGGLLMAYNILLLSAVVLTGHFTYLLARELFGTAQGRIPAVLAGVVFAFCPARWTSTMLGHMNLINTQWIPLYLLFLVRFLRRGRRRDAIWTAVFAAAILYTGYQLLVFTIYWSGVLLVPLWTEIRWRRWWRRYAAGAAIFLLVFAALGSPILAGAVAERDTAVVRFDSGQAKGLSLGLKAISLDYPFTRFYRKARWQRWLSGETLAEEWTPKPPGRLAEMIDRGPIFGYSVALILLAGLALRPSRGGGWRYLGWLVPMIFFTYMLLGPHPTFFGRPFPALYNRFSFIPVLGAVRGVYRFAIPMMLGIALAAAWSCRGWLETLRCGPGGAASDGGGYAGAKARPAGTGPRQRACLLFLLVPFMVYIDYLRIPLPVDPIPQPPAVYRSATFSARVAGTAVMELPLWITGADFHHGEEVRAHLYYQTVLGLPMVNGHMSRLSAGQVVYFTSRPSLMRLTRRGTEGYTDIVGQDLESVVRDFGVGVINVSREQYLPEEEAALTGFLERWLRLEEVYRDERFITYVATGSGDGPSP